MRGLGGLWPALGQRIIGVFDAGVAGAEDLDRTVAAMGTRFLGAFEGAIRRGGSLGDVLKSLVRDLAELALKEIQSGGLLGGLFDILGGLFTSTALPGAGIDPGPHRLGNAKGNAFDMGARLDKFAKGGALTNSIVNRPTLFPMADGAGLMGEAGPEAVLPLTRLSNGDLGVKGLAA